MGNPVYIAVDEAAGLMSYVSNYDAASLRAAEDMGVAFYAVLEDGSWEEVGASDIEAPAPETHCLEIPQPAYIDDRMEAVVEVFDALAQSLPATAGTLGTAGRADRSAFGEALERLKEIVYKGANDANA